jgi:hypothetical protein
MAVPLAEFRGLCFSARGRQIVRRKQTTCHFFAFMKTLTDAAGMDSDFLLHGEKTQRPYAAEYAFNSSLGPSPSSRWREDPDNFTEGATN